MIPLVQRRGNSSANALELHLLCTNPMDHSTVAGTPPTSDPETQAVTLTWFAPETLDIFNPSLAHLVTFIM